MKNTDTPTTPVWAATGYGRVSNFRQADMIVAAPSRAAAARAMGVSSSWLAKYGDTTGNRADIEVALSQPGTLFYRRAGAFAAPWSAFSS